MNAPISKFQMGTEQLGGFEKLSRYEIGIFNIMQRSIHELERLQANRKNCK